MRMIKTHAHKIKNLENYIRGILVTTLTFDQRLYSACLLQRWQLKKARNERIRNKAKEEKKKQVELLIRPFKHPLPLSLLHPPAPPKAQK